MAKLRLVWRGHVARMEAGHIILCTKTEEEGTIQKTQFAIIYLIDFVHRLVLRKYLVFGAGSDSRLSAWVRDRSFSRNVVPH
jgi:hypothetical protein